MKISRVNSCLSVAGTGDNSVPPEKQRLSLPLNIRFYSQRATDKSAKTYFVKPRPYVRA